MRLLLILSIASYQVQGFAYSSKDIKLSKYEYQNLVKPSLNQIYESYKNLTTKLGKKNKALIDIFDEYDEIKKASLSFQKSCSRPDSPDCVDILDTYLSSYKKISLLIEKDKGFHKAATRYQAYNSNILKTYNHIYNFRYQYKANIHESKKVWPLLKKIEGSYNEFNFLVTKQSLPQIKKHLHLFWSDYIKILFNKVLQAKDRELFKKRLGSLNQSWNVFHVMMTKRNIDVPKDAKQVMLSMHRRWNYILKVTLR